MRSAESVPDATKGEPSDKLKVVGLKVAVKVAEVKSSMLGNWTRGFPSASSDSPGPRLPKLNVCGAPLVGVTVSEAFSNVNESEAKGGPRIPPKVGPVKLKISNAFVPCMGGVVLAGMKTSNEKRPTAIPSARAKPDANESRARVKRIRRVMPILLYNLLDLIWISICVGACGTQQTYCLLRRKA